jgi:hypothetical protein
MKKIILVFSLVLGALSSNAQDGAKALIKNSPFHFFDGTFNMSYEKAISNSKSLNFSGGFHLQDNSSNSEGDIGWIGELQLRKYLINFKKERSVLSGVYVAPYIKGAYFRSEGEDYLRYALEDGYYDENNLWIQEVGYYNSYSKEIKNIQGGLLMGAQLLFGSVISFEVFLGGGMQYAEVEGFNSDYYNTSNMKEYTGVIPRIGFNIGAAF